MTFEIKQSLRPLRNTIRRNTQLTEKSMDLPKLISLTHTEGKVEEDRAVNYPCTRHQSMRALKPARNSLSKISQWPRKKLFSNESPLLKERSSCCVKVVERKRPMNDITPPIRRKSQRLSNENSDCHSSCISLKDDYNRRNVSSSIVEELRRTTKIEDDSIPYSIEKSSSASSSATSIPCDFNTSTCEITIEECNELNSSRVTTNSSYSHLTLSTAIAVDDSPSYQIGVTIFNYNPIKGMRFLLENQFIQWDPKEISEKLKEPCFSRQAVGEFFGSSSDPLALPTLEKTIQSIPMTGLTVDEALRSLLYLFHPNGESQKISSLLMSFSEEYVKCNPNTFDVDTIHTLSYAIIMLHTDHFNPSANRHYQPMTCDQFIRNIYTIKDTNIPKRYLEEVFARVTSNKFEVMPDYSQEMRDLDRILVGNLKSSKFCLRHRRFIKSISPVNEVEFKVGRKTLRDHQQHTRRLFIFNDMLVLAKEKRERQSINIRKSLATLFEHPTMIPKTDHTIKTIIRLKDLIVIPCSSSSDHYCLELITADRVKHQLSFDSQSARQTAIDQISKGIQEINQLSKYEH